MSEETPDCECHRVPMYWSSDKGKRMGGIWRCRIQRRARDLAGDRTARNARALRYWHKAEGGYVRRRRRELAGQREQIQTRLTELKREMEGYRA